jgi:hypothetical protein
MGCNIYALIFDVLDYFTHDIALAVSSYIDIYIVIIGFISDNAISWVK